MRSFAVVSPEEERLEREVEQLELATRLCEADLQRYRDAIAAEQAPNVARLQVELAAIGAKVSTNDLAVSLAAAGLRVIAWGCNAR